ncbi:hypothetical protein MDA_GLEAN10013408 [Myotis davidii]|uniref:Uncharacterized protein n=1 Tax=Myotis davidii TaxID=225400 RepID=L5LWS1_MYODS|nr:hypothetical protein MDA_GLEAN10013408 [Myotis davidii]
MSADARTFSKTQSPELSEDHAIVGSGVDPRPRSTPTRPSRPPLHRAVLLGSAAKGKAMLSHSSMVRQRKQQAAAIMKEIHRHGTLSPCGVDIVRTRCPVPVWRGHSEGHGALCPVWCGHSEARCPVPVWRGHSEDTVPCARVAWT